MKITARLSTVPLLLTALTGVITPLTVTRVLALTPSTPKIEIRADRQNFDKTTGVATALGNVKIIDQARNIQATAAQAQYFTHEHQIVLNGDVHILQDGQIKRTERTTYLVDQGQFISD